MVVNNWSLLIIPIIKKDEKIIIALRPAIPSKPSIKLKALVKAAIAKAENTMLIMMFSSKLKL